MADLAELLVAKTAKEYGILTRNPGDKLRVNIDQKLVPCLLKLTKSIHDSAQSYDKNFSSEFIPELIIDGFDDEQIYQEQELENEVANRKLLEAFATSSIESTSIAFFVNKKVKEKKKQTNLQDGEDDQSRFYEKGHMSDLESESDHKEEESDESDDELLEIKKRIKNRDKDSSILGLENLSDGGSDQDDTLFKGVLESEGEDDDADVNELENEQDFDFEIPGKGKVNKETKSKDKAPVRRRTEVDDKFFKLAEMEDFLEQEDRREEQKQKQETKKDADKEGESSDESEDESENIDMFGDWSEAGEGEEAMYTDFFDPPADGDENQKMSTKQETQDKDESSDDEDIEDEEMESDEEPSQEKKKVSFSKDTKSKQEKHEKTQEKTLSSFEQRSERLLRQIQGLEDQSLQPRQWQMSGEVAAKARPENSLLEEHVEFEQTAPVSAEITEEFTQSIEELIKQRIKDKAFDDNQRQVRPREEAFELKTQKTLDQDKSKLSLHEVYEQEYLKLHAPEEDETNPQHEEIKKMMAFLFPRLDALASWHYRPTQAVPEVKIKSNLPAIQMEEATPITMVNSNVMAPEEVKAKKKGEVVGKTERTKEDKKRERRQKKGAKREKAKAKEKHMKEVEKTNPGLGNKYSKQRALKELEKQSKGNIEVIKEKKSKKSMSSKTFFTKLQEEATTQIQEKSNKKKDKEKTKHYSSSKLLL